MGGNLLAQEVTMAVDRELSNFVRRALAAGQPRDAVAQALAQAGWGRDQVRRALAEYADVPFPVPVPRPRPYLSAREAFLYLVLFATLYDSALALGALFYALIDHAWPDAASAGISSGSFRDSLRLSVAQLAVAFPVFVMLTVSLRRAIAHDPTRRDSRVRKWLTYVTLFLGACVLIGDAAALFYRLLGGELTARFASKVLVVGAIAGTIFTSYLRDLRSEEGEESQTGGSTPAGAP
jgi:hypothetical protein